MAHQLRPIILLLLVEQAQPQSDRDLHIWYMQLNLEAVV